MSIRRDYFLEQFDSNFRSHIIEFSKKLTELSTHYDVLIFLARKAACLADCFSELELSNYHCIVTSSRVLDMDLSWLRDKKVAIIDDALISGTTLNEANKKLSDCRAEKIDTYVLSIDNDWWSKELVLPKEPFFKLNSEQTSLICSNIVDAISVVPRPYSIDYPLYKNLRIKDIDFPDLSNSADWIVYESTSTHQERYNVINLTIKPSEYTANGFLDKLGLPNDNNFLLKIRLYALKQKNLYWCHILPIFILPPLSFENLDKIFYRITENAVHLRSWFSKESEDDNYKAKLRLVQYYLGSRLGILWRNDIINKIDDSLLLEQDIKNLNFLFPPPISDEIKHLAYADDIKFDDLNIQFGNYESVNDLGLHTSPVEQYDEQVALYKLTKPFLELFTQKELKARTLVKELGLKVFENKEYKDIIDRLNQGYSLSELKNFIKDISAEFNPARVVSYFLDIYIDRGAVVPITYINNNLIYRAFRHGEDVEFSENEIRLCISMLKKLAKEYGSEKLPHTIVEKALVLFIRVGLQQNFLRLSTYPMGDFKTMGIRYYLHGAIVGSFDESPYKVNFSSSLTHVLEEAGYLKRENFKDPYTILDAPTTGVSADGLSKSNQLGLVLGNLLNHSKPKLSLDELIIMSTCPYPIDVVGAMAAEIYIFLSLYFYDGNAYFGNYESNSLKKLSAIRGKNAFTAINSGTWKYENYKQNTSWSIIKRLSKSFENDLYGSVWEGFWPFTGQETSNPDSNSEIILLIERLADWLFTTRFFINIAEASFYKDFSDFEKSHSYKELNAILEACRLYLPNQMKNFERIYNNTVTKFKSGVLLKEKMYEYAIEKIKQNCSYGRQLLSEVDALSSNFGKVSKSASYEHAVVIDFKSFNKPMHELLSLYKDVLNRIKIEAKKAGQTFLFEIPKYHTAIKTGFWICSTGKNSRRWLLKFCSELTASLADMAVLKFTFFFHLDNFKIIKKTTSNEYYAPQFWEIAKELLKKKFKLNEGHEVVYFTNSFANREFIEKEIANELSDYIHVKGGYKEIEINNPYLLKFASNHFKSSKTSKVKNLMDIGIITIVAEELVAATDYFKKNTTYKEYKGALNTRKFYLGKIKSENNLELNVAIIQAREQGNRSVISAYNALAEEFNPKMVVLLGIAGSIKPKVKLCDVVIADAVYYYDKRAVEESGTKHRIDPFKLNAWTKELLNYFHLQKRAEEPKYEASEESYESTFTSYLGPIGSGEAVIKFREAEERRWLETVNDKTLALETEASGFAQQFYEDELNFSRRAQGILVVRGISDHADYAKDDKWRLPASANAMKVLADFLIINIEDLTK